MTVSSRALERYALATGDLEGHPPGPLKSIISALKVLFLYRHRILDHPLVAQMWRESTGTEGGLRDGPWW